MTSSLGLYPGEVVWHSVIDLWCLSICVSNKGTNSSACRMARVQGDKGLLLTLHLPFGHLSSLLTSVELWVLKALPQSVVLSLPLPERGCHQLLSGQWHQPPSGLPLPPSPPILSDTLWVSTSGRRVLPHRGGGIWQDLETFLVVSTPGRRNTTDS